MEESFDSGVPSGMALEQRLSTSLYGLRLSSANPRTTASWLKLAGERGSSSAGLAHRLEPGLAIEHVDRGVTVDAGARLRLLGHALGHALVVEHVGVAARRAVVDRERVARVQAPQPRLLVELARRHGARTAVEPVARRRLPAVELVRPVLAPGRGSVVSSFTSASVARTDVRASCLCWNICTST